MMVTMMEFPGSLIQTTRIRISQEAPAVAKILWVGLSVTWFTNTTTPTKKEAPPLTKEVPALCRNQGIYPGEIEKSVEQ